MQKILQRCRKVSLKLKKCVIIGLHLFYGDVISRNGVQLDTQKIKALMEMPPPNSKIEFQAFLGIINYLSKFSPSTATISEPLRKLTSSRAMWMWNVSYQALYDKTKSLIKADVCMKFYNETKPLYLKTDASGIGLGATLLQARDGTTCPKDIAPANTIVRPIMFASKSLISAEHRYSNIEKHWYTAWS